MRYLIAVLFLSVSVFLLIFAKQFYVKTDQKLKNSHDWKLTDEPSRLFWFLQISDIHISKFRGDAGIVQDLRTFCSEVTDVVKPKVVIASGDLTDAKDKILGSQQYIEEWKAYHSTLLDTGIFNKTTWLDIRGNHDNFNLEHLYSSADLFRNFSAQGPFHKKSYLHQEVVDGLKYNFMALDASVEPGTKRPYNFIGMVPHDELVRVEKLMNDSSANFTVWFAHYPTSTILTPPGHDHIRKLVGKYEESAIFVAGHLHTLGGLVFKMYSLQPEGFLELELGDFTRNRLFRLGVFDHGLFSFADVKLGTWPIAVITNPKDILFNNPFKENISLQKESSHIRIVAFSTSSIAQCKIRINNGDWEKCEKKTDNFFTVHWHPMKYAHGKHKIEVFIGDKNGKIFTREQFFSLDGSRTQFDFLAKFVLMSDISTVFQVGFLMAFTLCLTPLVIFKSWEILIRYGKMRRPKIASQYLRHSIQKYLVFASIDRVFWSVFAFCLYTAIGPWSFHEVLDGHTGYFFVWGTYIKGEFVTGTLSWWYGFHQMLFFQLPLGIIMAGVLRRRFIKFLTRYSGIASAFEDDTILQTLNQNLPFLALLTAEVLLAIFYIIQNGFLMFLIAPVRAGSIVVSCFLFYQAHWKITDQEFKQSALICSPESKLATS